jgi:hypothetical protein
MNRLITLALLLVALLAFVGPPAMAATTLGQTRFTQGYWGEKFMWVWAFDTLKAGSVVVWKADSIVARAAKPCTNTVAQAFTDTLDWGPYHRLRLDCKAGDTGWVQACTAFVTGVDTTGAAKTCTTAIADGDTLVWVSQTWSKIRTLKISHAHLSDSVLCYGYPIKCVTTTTSNENIAVAGVVMDTAAAKVKYTGSGVDSYVRLCTDGVTPCWLVAEARRPGQYLATSTTAGSGTIASSPAEGSVYARNLYAGTGAAKVPVLVHTQ